MSEHTEEHAGAAAGAVNHHGMASNSLPHVEDQAASVEAAAAPCDCEPRLAAIEKVARAAAYLAIVCAAGLMYLLWFGERESK